MVEAVRFYWLRGDATLPVSAIPEEERVPIRVRRSIAQRHVPEVVKLLEANRFVAAAWPAGACTTMILGATPRRALSWDLPFRQLEHEGFRHDRIYQSAYSACSCL